MTRTTTPATRTESTSSTRKLAVVPRFDETIAPEFYRQAGKIRAITLALMMLLYFAQTIGAASYGIDVDYMRKLWWASVPLMVADISLSVVMWRRPLSSKAARRISITCVVLECALVLGNMQAVGSVNSHMVPFAVLVVLIYRLAFDFGAGITGLVLMLAGHWAIVGCEVAGWLEPQPLGGTGPKDAIYALPSREASAMLMISGSYVIAFLFANWAVARMRHKDIALRLLRESIYLRDPGKIGRDTGRTLRGTYSIGALLGTGGMGSVYRGEHVRTRRPVAIKLLHAHLVEDATLLKRFRREAEVVGTVASQHIVEVIDVDEDDGQPFLVLELLAGESLRQRIATLGPLPPAMVVDIVSQVAAGLAAAHGAGVVHRDLKPENVFLCPRPGGGDVVKILDFGISKVLGAATAITNEVALLGTPDFMAPEQAIGTTESIDARTDVYALGAMTYCMLTARPPFIASSVPALLRRVCEDDPIAVSVLRPEIPARADYVIGRAMAKTRDIRPADPRTFVRELAEALGIDHTAPPPERPSQQTAPAPRASVPDDAFAATVAPNAATVAPNAGRAAEPFAATIAPDEHGPGEEAFAATIAPKQSD